MGKDIQTGETYMPGTRSQSQPFFGHDPYDNDFFFRGEHEYRTDTTPSKDVAEPDKQVAEPSGQEAENPGLLREMLVKEFQKYTGKVVGDPEFDDIITQEKWDEKKKAENEKLDENKRKKVLWEGQVKDWEKGGKVGPKPPKPSMPYVEIFTTCIEIQRKTLEHAFKASGLTIKKVLDRDEKGNVKKSKTMVRQFGYGSVGPAQAKEAGAWHEASRNMSERPRKGDLLILAGRGEEVDKAAKEVANYELLKKMGEDATAKVADYEQKAQLAQQAVKAAEGGDIQALKAARRAMIDANNAYDNVLRKTKEAIKMGKTAEKLLPASEQKFADRRAAADHDDPRKFFFSHVGFLTNIEKNKDGTESWTTFDGGQPVISKNKRKEGAAANSRPYDPITNEITGEWSQGGEARWLQGWIDVDKLVDSK